AMPEDHVVPAKAGDRLAIGGSDQVVRAGCAGDDCRAMSRRTLVVIVAVASALIIIDVPVMIFAAIIIIITMIIVTGVIIIVAVTILGMIVVIAMNVVGIVGLAELRPAARAEGSHGVGDAGQGGRPVHIRGARIVGDGL